MAAADRSFAEFIEFVLRIDELLHDSASGQDGGVPRGRLRDRLNPLEHFTDREFLFRYRFTKESVLLILERLHIEENSTNRGLPLSPMLQLLVALRFYGSGTFQTVAGDLVNVSQPTVCRVVERISRLIASKLFGSVVKFPEDFDRTMHEFHEIANFPGVTGCIDCTHVRIKRPSGSKGEVYRNRKGYFSINVQAVTGPKLQFYDVVASWPGSVHDSRIFDSSHVRVKYARQEIPGILLGDAGYACVSFLMTPLANPGAPGSPEARYQAAHVKTRNTVERTFGIWKRRFPCLDMRLQHLPDHCPIIITACAALHNLAGIYKDPCPPALPSSPHGAQHQRHHQMPQPQPTDSVGGNQARRRLIVRCFS